MFSKATCLYLQGIQGIPVAVEADVSDGLPGFSLVGYLAAEVREAQDRVRTAIKNMGFSLPPKKVTVNLSPADFRKEGTGFDLAIAAAVLSAYGLLPPDALKDRIFLGELGLDGTVKPIPGILVLADSARELHPKTVYLPTENVTEASMIAGLPLAGVSDLRMLCSLLRGEPAAGDSNSGQAPPVPELNSYTVDFSEVNGQRFLRRAAEVAAAGMHNLLMIGPAGSGKTMVAKRLPTIIPGLELSECIEISKLYSVCGRLSDSQPLITRRPFREPHHTISAQALAGGGAKPKPGEISLATGGILFLDELPEMGHAALETLRQPLEERRITISRVQGTVCYPADFQLVAAMNPCLCGYYPGSRCTCREGERIRYQRRISRPLLDRIDICVEADPLTYAQMRENGENESSAAIRSRVEAARKRQSARFAGQSIQTNGQMQGNHVRSFCSLRSEENRFMKQVFEELSLSARTFDKILKVARTIADLEGEAEIRKPHLSEAVAYARVKERYWSY